MSILREGSPWFLVPFHVRVASEEGYSREASWRLDPKTQELIVDIAATHPKIGKWTAHLNGVDLKRSEISLTKVIYDESGFSSGAGYQEHLQWNSYTPDFATQVGAASSETMSSEDPFLETLRLLAKGSLKVEGVTVNTNGTIHSTNPSGIKVIVSGEDGSAVLVISSATMTA